MKKTILSTLFALCLCLCLLPDAQATGDPVTYIDPTGNSVGISPEALTTQSGNIELTGGNWYYIENQGSNGNRANIDTLRVTGTGAANLILIDNSYTYIKAVSGKLNIYAGITGDGGVYNSGVCGIYSIDGDVTLYGGLYDSEGVAYYSTYPPLPAGENPGWKLGTGFCFFRTDAGYLKNFPTGSYASANVVACPHTSISTTDKNCTFCGAPCPHKDVTNGACTVCETTFEAMETGDTYYATLADALTAASKKSTSTTITLLRDVSSFDASLEFSNWVTLRLNGKSVNAAEGGMLTVDGSAAKLEISDSNDTNSAAKVEFNVPITLKNGADLTLTNVKAGKTITTENSEKQSQLRLSKSELTQKLSLPSSARVIPQSEDIAFTGGIEVTGGKTLGDVFSTSNGYGLKDSSGSWVDMTQASCGSATTATAPLTVSGPWLKITQDGKTSEIDSATYTTTVTNGTEVSFQSGIVTNSKDTTSGDVTYAWTDTFGGNTTTLEVSTQTFTHTFTEEERGIHIIACTATRGDISLSFSAQVHVTCPHTTYQDGKCTDCSALCPHTNENGVLSVDTDGKCKICHQLVVAIVKIVRDTTEGWYYYADIADALTAANAATEGEVELTLLKDWSASAANRTTITRSMTLDLNGKELRGISSFSISGENVVVTMQDSTGSTDNPGYFTASLEVSSGATLKITGGKYKSLTIVEKVGEAKSGKAELSGGTFVGSILNNYYDATTGRGSAHDLLAEGYAYRGKLTDGGTEAWVLYSNNSIMVGGSYDYSALTVKAAPIRSLSVSPSGETTLAYGDTMPTLTASATNETGYTGTIAYQWYTANQKSPNNAAEIEGATSAAYTPDRLEARQEGYIYRVAATLDGYTLTKDVTIKVNKGTLTEGENYTAPTARTGLIYNGQEQELVQAGSVPEGTTMWYQTVDLGGLRSQDVPKTAGVGVYNVSWIIDGGTNYESVDVDGNRMVVRIDPKDISDTTRAEVVNITVSDLPYIGQSQSPAITAKLQSTDDSGTTTVHETLREGDHYTLSDDLSAVGVGTYSVTLTGKGDYTGTKTVTWRITKGAAPSLPDNRSASARYNETGVTKQLSWQSIGMPEDAGTITYGKGGEASKTGDVFVSDWSVSDSGLVSVSFSGGAVGNTITLPVTVHSANYEDATVNVVVTLTDKDTQAALVITSANTATYRTYLQLSTSGGSGTGRVSYSVTDGTGSAVINDGGRLYPTKVGTVTVTATKEGNDRYNSITSEPMTITIGKVRFSGEPRYTAITTSGKTLDDANLRNNESWYKVNSSIGWVDENGNSLPGSTEVQPNTEYRWLFTVDESDIGNCEPTTLTGSITLWVRSDSGSSGSSGSSSKPVTPPTTTTITVPVSSDAGSVEVKAEVTETDGGTATATVEISDEQIKQVAAHGSGTVTVDVSKLENVESVQVPAHVVETTNQAEDTGLTVALPTGTVALDATALKSVSTGEDVSVSVKKVPATDLTEAQQKAVGDMANIGLVVDVDLTVGKEKQSAFNGGKLTISVPYTPKRHEDVSKLTVWFIHDDGTIENKGGYYDAEKGCFVFETEHLSRYVLVYDNKAPSFPDVPTTAYFYNAVNWAVGKGITNGVDGGLFAPDLSCTRAQIVTFLYRCAVAQGVDVSVGESTNILSYADVFEVPKFAIEAFQWAVGAGIVNGADGKLMPNDDCTRAQIVTMLYRYAVSTGKDLSVGEDTNILSYNDAFEVPKFATEAFQWACGAGIIQGADGKLMPNDTCTRGQIVTMLYRAMNP